MKKKFNLTYIVVLLPLFSMAQLTNNGATLEIETGGQVISNGNIENINGATLINNGEISIQGDFTNNGTISSGIVSLVTMEGSGGQTMDMNNAILNDLYIDNTDDDITLASDLTVNGLLDFFPNTENIVLADNDLTIGPIIATNDLGRINRQASAGWIVAEGTGHLIRDYSGESVDIEFPIGGEHYYTPLTAHVTSGTVATGTIGVNITDAAHPDLPLGATDYLTRYWDINETGMGNAFSADITAIHATADVGGAMTNSAIVGSNYDGVEWDYTNAMNLGNKTISGTISGDRSFTGSNINLFLPIKLLSFEVEKQDEKHSIVTWETTEEINNDYFEIQRSADAKDFHPIGIVAASKMTELIHFYQFIDKKPIYNQNYYRLKQVDFNESYTYSEVISIDFSSNIKALETFPNPASNHITISLNKSFDRMSIIDNLGQLIKTFTIQELDNNEIKLNLTELKTGTYIISGIINSIVINQKFVKI